MAGKSDRETGAREPSNALRRSFGVAALALGSLLVAAAAAEVAARLFAPLDGYYAPPSAMTDDGWRTLLHRPSDVPGLAYEMVPHTRGVTRGMTIRTNRFGMRDDEPLPADTPGLSRIAVLGDSISFGFRVGNEETYAYRLEQQLAASPLRPQAVHDVLNFAVSGYSTRDEAAQLRHRVADWRPELLIVGYSLNDPETEPFQPLQARFSEVKPWQHSHLLRLLVRAWTLRDMQRLGGGDYVRYLHAHPQKWQSVLDGFRSIAEVARSIDARVLLLILPTLPATESWDGYPYGEVHAQVERAAREAGFEVLDLLPAYAAVPPPALRVSEADAHPNASGHALIADAVRRHLAGLGSRPAKSSDDAGERSR